jgi:hypothetical protein
MTSFVHLFEHVPVRSRHVLELEAARLRLRWTALTI